MRSGRKVKPKHLHCIKEFGLYSPGARSLLAEMVTAKSYLHFRRVTEGEWTGGEEVTFLPSIEINPPVKFFFFFFGD